MIGQNVSHYLILEKLGEGGMGVVYKAHDTTLDRTVALKFLPHHLTSDPSEKERFYHEARAAAALTHAHVAVIHEIGEHEGELFIAMEYIEGKTLKEKILEAAGTQGSGISHGEAVEYAIQVASGLAAAHERGIVHRDVKPENIIITPRAQAKITDFGLAKLKGATKLTKAGSTLGTAAYMSPEQARGEEVDQRTDIFSFGVVLYEMLTAHLPFRGEHTAALAYSIANDAPPPMARYNERVSDELQRIVSKALEKDRGDRYQHIDEMLSDLKREQKKIEYARTGYPNNSDLSPLPAEKTSIRVWFGRIAIGIAALGMLVVLAMFFNPFREKTLEPGVASTDPKSVAVLPFVDMSPQKDQGYFCDGMTEALINRLGNIKGLRVPARTSAFMFKGKEQNVQEIGKALQVRTVLEGSVQKSGRWLRITAQLVNVDDGYQIWSQVFDREIRDVFVIQDEISSAIVTALRLSVTPEARQRMARAPIDNIAAYECYLKAYDKIWQFNARSLDSAIRYLNDGIAIVGDNPLLYSALAQSYWQYVNVGAGQEDDIAKAEKYARKALALDPGFAAANEVMASIYKDFLGNLREGVRYYRMALADNPNEPEALRKLAYTYIVDIGRPDAAVELIGRAKQVDPLDPWKHFIEGMQYLYGGQHHLMLEPFRAFFQTDTANPLAQFFYAWALELSGRRDDGFTVINNSKTATPENVCTKFGLLLQHGVLKERGLALRELTPDFRRTCRRDPEWSYYVGLMLSLCDARTEALDWLENAVSRGFYNYPQLAQNSYLTPLHDDVRFKKLLERAKYEWEHFEISETSSQNSGLIY